MAGEDQCHPTQVGQDWARGLFFSIVNTCQHM
jgi:hypothetical protein